MNVIEKYSELAMLINAMTEQELKSIADIHYVCDYDGLRDRFADFYDKFEGYLQSDDPEKVRRAKYTLTFLVVLFSVDYVIDTPVKKDEKEELHIEDINTDQI